MLHLRRHRSAHFQPLQDPALLQVRPFAAAMAQVDQLCLQRQQAVDAGLDVVDVFVDQRVDAFALVLGAVAQGQERSEEHKSELQSLMRISYAVFCLKKKKTITYLTIYTQ